MGCAADPAAVGREANPDRRRGGHRDRRPGRGRHLRGKRQRFTHHGWGHGTRWHAGRSGSGRHGRATSGRYGSGVATRRVRRVRRQRRIHHHADPDRDGHRDLVFVHYGQERRRFYADHRPAADGGGRKPSDHGERPGHHPGDAHRPNRDGDQHRQSEPRWPRRATPLAGKRQRNPFGVVAVIVGLATDRAGGGVGGG